MWLGETSTATSQPLMALKIKTMKYTIGAKWFNENKQTYGDLEWATEDDSYPSVGAARDYIGFLLGCECEGSMTHRTEEAPDPCVLYVVNDEGDAVYRVANCSEEVASEYGIVADEYMETMG